MAKVVCTMTHDGAMACLHRNGQILPLAPWVYPSEPKQALPWGWTHFYGRWCLAYAILIAASGGKQPLSVRLSAQFATERILPENPARMTFHVRDVQEWIAAKCAESIR